MSDLSEMSILRLANRLNELHVEMQQLEWKNIKNEELMRKLNEEYDEIVYELWDRIPSLCDDVNIQPKKRVRRDERSWERNKISFIY